MVAILCPTFICALTDLHIEDEQCWLKLIPAMGFDDETLVSPKSTIIVSILLLCVCVCRKWTLDITGN